MPISGLTLGGLRLNRRRGRWTPAALGANLALWLDAADSSTITLNYVSPTGNLVPQPENAGAWTTASGAFTLNQTTAPDNTLTADRFTPTAVNGYFAPAPSQPANVEHTFSLYLKDNGLTSVNVLAGGGGNNYGYTINLVTGAFSWTGSTTQQPVTSVAVVNCGNGWFNVAMTTTAVNPVLFLVSSDINVNGINGVFAWGAQVITGSSKARYKTPQVSQWNDKSGNTRHATQATAANQPTYTATGLNGKPVLTFTGTKFLSRLNDTVLQNVPALSAFTVVSYADFVTAKRSVSITTTAGGAGRLITIGAIGGVLQSVGRRLSSDSFSTSNGAVVVATTPVIHGSQLDFANNSNTAVVNGVVGPVATFSSGAGNSESSLVDINMGTAIPTQLFLGVMAETVFVNGILSLADRQLLEGYFAWKWSGLI